VWSLLRTLVFNSGDLGTVVISVLLNTGESGDFFTILPWLLVKVGDLPKTGESGAFFTSLLDDDRPMIGESGVFLTTLL